MCLCNHNKLKLKETTQPTVIQVCIAHVDAPRLCTVLPPELSGHTLFHVPCSHQRFAVSNSQLLAGTNALQQPPLLQASLPSKPGMQMAPSRCPCVRAPVHAPSIVSCEPSLGLWMLCSQLGTVVMEGWAHHLQQN